MSASVRHDVVVGPAGPTRNNVVANLITDGLKARDTTASWLIDMHDVHPALPGWTARTLTNARSMLASLNTFRPSDQDRGLCVTIENASEVLKDRQIRDNLENILRGASTASIKFRLVVESRDVSSFGGSKVIRDEVLAGNIIKAVQK